MESSNSHFWTFNQDQFPEYIHMIFDKIYLGSEPAGQKTRTEFHGQPKPASFREYSINMSQDKNHARVFCYSFETIKK